MSDADTLPPSALEALRTLRRLIAPRLADNDTNDAAHQAYERLTEAEYWLRKALA